MRTSLIAFILCTSLAFAQTAAKKPAAPAQKPAPTAKKPSAGTAAAAPGKTKAIFDTTAGTLTCTLFPKEAPETVANFVGLATGTKDWKNPVSHATKHNTPLYDGTIFHRVIPDFMIQGGDPAGNGSGGPGYSFKDEFVPTLKFDKGGVLAMANSGPGTNGSQFFITEAPTPWLNGKHTIFGQCDAASVALVKKIARMARDERNDRPFRPVKINHIAIQQPGAAAAAPAGAKKTSGAAPKSAPKPSPATPTKK